MQLPLACSGLLCCWEWRDVLGLPWWKGLERAERRRLQQQAGSTAEKQPPPGRLTGTKRKASGPSAATTGPAASTLHPHASTVSPSTAANCFQPGLHGAADDGRVLSQHGQLPGGSISATAEPCSTPLPQWLQLQLVPLDQQAELAVSASGANPYLELTLR